MTSTPMPNSSTHVPFKNVSRNRSNIGWKNCISIDRNPRQVQCKFNQKIVSGGVYWLKHHLVGTQKDVLACLKVIDEVNKQIWDIVVDLQQNLVNKSTINQEEENVEVGAKRNVNKATNNTKNISRREESTHKLISMSCLRRD